MTTAARSAFERAKGWKRNGVGGLSQLSKPHSGRELPSQTKITYGQTTQDAPQRFRHMTSRRGLEERAAAGEKKTEIIQPQNVQPPLRVKEPSVRPDSHCQPSRRRSSRTGEEDEDLEEKNKDSEAAALLAELEKIEKERAGEQARKERAQKAEERIHMENILSGNPLLNLSGPSQPQANFKFKSGVLSSF